MQTKYVFCIHSGWRDRARMQTKSFVAFTTAGAIEHRMQIQYFLRSQVGNTVQEPLSLVFVFLVARMIPRIVKHVLDIGTFKCFIMVYGLPEVI